MFEKKHEPLIPRHRFLRRLGRCGFFAALLVSFSWGLGILGYHYFVSLEWLDATLNAAMILTGMGPVDPIHTAAGKLFASFYALFSGVVFITTASLLLGPVAHRLLHHFHAEIQERESKPKKAKRESD